MTDDKSSLVEWMDADQDGVKNIDLEASLSEQNLGRGGFSVWVANDFDETAIVNFKIEVFIDTCPLFLEGYGVTRWLKDQPQKEKKLAGIEILYLSPQSAAHFQTWLRLKAPAPFIPKAE